MINELIKLATHLDNKGLPREANYLDAVIKNAEPDDYHDFFGPEEKVDLLRPSGDDMANLSQITDENVEEVATKTYDGETEDSYKEELLFFFEGHKRELAENFLEGVKATLQGADFGTDDDPERYLSIASNMVHKGFLQEITRSEGRRGDAVNNIAKLFGIWADQGAEDYFRNYIDELEASFQEEGRSWLSKGAKMINDLIKLATHLDNKGFQKEADYLDAVIKNAKKKKEEPEVKSSKWHRMKMSRVVEEMHKNDFDSLTFKVSGYNVRISKTDEE